MVYHSWFLCAFYETYKKKRPKIKNHLLSIFFFLFQPTVHNVRVSRGRVCGCGWWHGDRWQVACDKWQVTGDRWQVTDGSWQVTGDRLHRGVAGLGPVVALREILHWQTDAQTCATFLLFCGGAVEAFKGKIDKVGVHNLHLLLKSRFLLLNSRFWKWSIFLDKIYLKG